MFKIEIIERIGFVRDKQIGENQYIEIGVPFKERGDDQPIWITILQKGDGGERRKYLQKGAKIYVRGDLSLGAYVSKNGGKPGVDATVWAREIEVVEFLREKEGQEDGQASPAESVQTLSGVNVQPVAKPVAKPVESLAPDPEDLPF